MVKRFAATKDHVKSVLKALDDLGFTPTAIAAVRTYIEDLENEVERLKRGCNE